MTVSVRRPLTLTAALLRKRLPALYGIPEQDPIDEESVEQFIEDVLRSVIWSRGQSELGAHIKAISGRSGAILNSGMLDDVSCRQPIEELVKDALGRLRLIGDIVKLKQGRYAPGPLRLVRLDDEHTQLVGGIPTHLLPASVRDSLVLGGSSRLLRGSPETRSNALPDIPYQSPGGWRQTPKVSLSELCRRWFNADRTDI